MTPHLFNCERIERRTPTGRLDAVGLAWSEYRPLRAEALRAMIGLCTAVGLLTAMAGVVILPFPEGRGLGLVLLASGVLIGWGGFVLFNRPIEGFARALLFHRDGRIELPHGTRHHPRMRELYAAHQDIVSIEARDVASGWDAYAYGYGVVVFMKDGAIVEVAASLHRDSGHMVAVRLSQALETMRHELLDLHAGRRAAASNGANRSARLGALIE